MLEIPARWYLSTRELLSLFGLYRHILAPEDSAESHEEFYRLQLISKPMKITVGGKFEREASRADCSWYNSEARPQPRANPLICDCATLTLGTAIALPRSCLFFGLYMQWTEMIRDHLFVLLLYCNIVEAVHLVHHDKIVRRLQLWKHGHGKVP